MPAIPEQVKLIEHRPEGDVVGYAVTIIPGQSPVADYHQLPDGRVISLSQPLSGAQVDQAVAELAFDQAPRRGPAKWGGK